MPSRVLELDYPGTGTIPQFSWKTGLQEVVNFKSTVGRYSVLSAAARHILDFHLASGSNNSYVTVDGGSHVGAFPTAAAADWNRLRLFGSTSTANVYVGNVYTSITGATGGFPPTSFFDSAGLSNGVTVTGTTFASSLHCGNTGTQFDPPVLYSRRFHGQNGGRYIQHDSLPDDADAVRVFLYGKHWNISSPQCSFRLVSCRFRFR